MIRGKNFFGFKVFSLTIIFLLALTNIFAASKPDDKKTHISIAKNLSVRLQNDLADSSAFAKLINVKEHKISENQIAVTGDAVCVLGDYTNQLPIRFDAKINSIEQTIYDIEYKFVSSEITPDFAPTSMKELLTKELMKQIGKDYNTENIVIAIDDFEDVSMLNNRNEMTGVGEVRIGDFVWNKIKFVVTLVNENQSLNRVVYKIEK